MDTITITPLDLSGLDSNTSIGSNTADTITLDWSNMNSGSYTVSTLPTITVSDLTSGYNFGNLTLNGGTGATGSNITSPYLSVSDLSLGNLNPSGTLTLKGENADIDINGESLMTMIRGIQDRLNILCPDPGMEAEWDELHAIREQYEAKLAECKEKARAWKALKSMPKINPEDL